MLRQLYGRIKLHFSVTIAEEAAWIPESDYTP
jgi:hypothetical protein